jgi:hypothetical protein
MGPVYSRESIERLNTVVPVLRQPFAEVLRQGFDHKILCGRRNRADQNQAFKEGRSKVIWPFSDHNTEDGESLVTAIDVAPYPVIWPDPESKDYIKQVARFYHFAGYALAVAKCMGIPLAWGGDWDRDFDILDQSFDDLVHFYLVHEDK